MKSRHEIVLQLWEATTRHGANPLGVDLESLFDRADEFLSLATKQRAPEEQACDKHKFVTNIGEFEREWIHCLKCGAPKVEPEPLKPERVARVAWVHTLVGSLIFTKREDCDFSCSSMCIPFQAKEILPGDGE